MSFKSTIFKADDSEEYKGFHLTRDKDGLIVVPGKEGKFIQYVIAKAAIDHHIAKSTITDDVTVTPVSSV